VEHNGAAPRARSRTETDGMDHLVQFLGGSRNLALIVLGAIAIVASGLSLVIFRSTSGIFLSVALLVMTAFITAVTVARDRH
jgi:hypothetical protein